MDVETVTPTPAQPESTQAPADAPSQAPSASSAAAESAAGEEAGAAPTESTTEDAPGAEAAPTSESAATSQEAPATDEEPAGDASSTGEESAAAEQPAAQPGTSQQSQPSEQATPSSPATTEPRTAEEQHGGEPNALLAVPGAEFAEIPIHEVRENPRNPRTMFDEDELDELAYSLREVGVLQPVVVRPIPVTPDGESFELVMGERRWRAARRAGLQSIPAIIRETSDDDLLRDALLENLHRTQLNPLEEANAYQQLLDDFGCTQDELGDRIGRSRPQITNTLRLLRLPALVQRRLASGAISAGHARALLSLDDPTLMEELAQRIVQEGLSVRAVERLVARGGQQQTGTRTVRRSTYDPHVVDLTSRLSNRLEAPVRIDVGKRKGRITLEFTNLEDLERLVENIGLDIDLPAEGTVES
ncbi:ParB/RepB/Spo0J family partition protein [Brachybacterium saurashtrense]|uniref:ParB/RepB/Spo0J family partition protein n=1 Tax=Brachybacterium saurashtrense TaxID=556288 RepID=UPI001F49AFA7|nr:ParB/RepB/Spo0J family partition protein [Brachybacterium saurashtrense]